MIGRLLGRERVWTSGRAEWALFALFFFSAAYFQHVVEYESTSNRYYLLSSVVDFHRIDLEMFRADAADLAQHESRFYSNKPIGLPLLAAPVYWGMRRFTLLKHTMPLSSIAAYITRIWAVTLPYALAGPILYHLLLAMGATGGDALLAVLIYALGTLAWVHASLFSGGQTAASLSLFSFVAAWRMSRKPAAEAWRWLGAGLLAGLAALCEFHAALTAALLMLYVFKRAKGPAPKLAFGAGLATCALLQAAYNQACFGRPWSFSSSAFGLTSPHLAPALRLLLSPSRGLFFTMPALVFSLAGFAKLWKRGEETWRPELIFIAALFLGQLALDACCVDWHSGWTFGPRHFVAILPFFAIPLAFGLDRIWVWPLFALSLFQMLAVQLVMPHIPQYVENPIIELLLPLWRDGYRSGTLASLLELSGRWAVALWLIPAALLAALAWPAREPLLRGARTSVIRSVAYGGVCAAVLLGLVLVRSPKPRLTQGYVVKLLSDYEQFDPSPRVEASIVREERLRLSMNAAAGVVGRPGRSAIAADK